MTDALLETLAEKYIKEEFAGEYDGQDLVNSLIILQQIANSLAWYLCETRGVPMNERKQKSKEFGMEIREAVTKFSGIDPHTVVGRAQEPITIPLQIIEK